MPLNAKDFCAPDRQLPAPSVAKTDGGVPVEPALDLRVKLTGLREWSPDVGTVPPARACIITARTTSTILDSE